MTISDLIGRHDSKKLDSETTKNLTILADKMSTLERIYKKPFYVISGYRAQEDQKRINPKESFSYHLNGYAVDISDVSGELRHWLSQNEKVLENLDLYCEAFQYTPTWVHFQIVPNQSGERLYRPHHVLITSLS